LAEAYKYASSAASDLANLTDALGFSHTILDQGLDGGEIRKAPSAPTDVAMHTLNGLARELNVIRQRIDSIRAQILG